MNLKVEINIDDFFNEDGEDLTSLMQSVITREVTKGIGVKFKEFIDSEINKAFQDSMSKVVDTEVKETIARIMQAPIEISTGWNSKETYKSAYDMVETKFNNLINNKARLDGECVSDVYLKQCQKHLSEYSLREFDSVIEKLKKQIDEYVKKKMLEDKAIAELKELGSKLKGL